MLRIHRSLEPKPCDTTQVPSDLRRDETADQDEEALVKYAPRGIRYTVVYDIVYSPTYMVPVLYVIIKQPLDQPRMSLEEIYDTLIPAAQRDQLRSVGPMGSLSMTNHPVTGMPAYFIHPCKTQEAMAAVAADRVLVPLEYLTLWLGLVGPSVGFSLPLELATDMASGRMMVADLDGSKVKARSLLER